MDYRVNNLLYAAGPELLNTIRMDIVLKEPVDLLTVQKAVDTAAARFPYYAVKLARRGEEYVFLPNPLPFVVSPEGRTVVLGSEQSNYHLFAFACDGCHLYMDSTHFITDGQGSFPFFKAILYYYLSAAHPEDVFDTRGIALAGSAVPFEESDDYPYPDEPLAEEPIGSITRPDEIFMLPGQPQGYEDMESWSSFRFRVKQKDMMSYVSSVDGSPATFIASLVYKAIVDIHPENHLPLVCGMQHQFRNALGRPLSHLCHVNIVPLVYPDSLRSKSIEQLNTIARGTLIIRADDANDVLTINRHVRNEKLIRGMDLAQKHAHMLREIMDGIGRNTFEVSYTGRVPWSGLDRYIADVVPYLDMSLSGGISVEIFSVGEFFSVNIMQRSRDPEITDRFAALLSCNGIPYTAEEPVHFDLCGFEFPR